MAKELMSYQFTTRRMLWWFFVAAIVLWAGRGCYLAIDETRNAAICASCDGRMNQLRLAIENYRDAKGNYPPLYIADANGKPMHSWRVLILPFIEEQQLYAAYNFNEPWDGPNNSKLADQMPENYRCFSMPNGNKTPYLAVSSSADKSVLDQTIKDPIMLVELHSKAVNWMQPDDISIDEFNKIISEANLHKHSIHNGQVGVMRKESRYKRIRHEEKE